MIKKASLLLVIILFFNGVQLQGQIKNVGFNNYEEFYQTISTDFKNKKYRKAIFLLESQIDSFPNNLHAIAYNLTIGYGAINKHNKGTKYLNFALENGIWFENLNFAGKFWDNYKNTKRFKEFQIRNKQAELEAKTNSNPEILIIKPNNYSTEKTYPLFIALHGNGGNNLDFQKLWWSEKLANNFIVAYLQSSQLILPGSYNWDNMDKACTEISDAYNSIKKTFNIDNSTILIGGYSTGGEAAINVSAKTQLPITGFILLSPTKPQKFNSLEITNLNSQNRTGVIITNKNDSRYNQHLEISEWFKTNYIRHRIIETPTNGAAITKNINIFIDSAIDIILDENK